ncbi:MAG: 3'(2'),5'-bisphosphate nucleotidase CysQ [Bacteroidaceae bacterium]|nr:3'(2'),5'-bisphosphate nucleotidase CysQ [Bacteroidaceae bacterium]
MTMNNNTQYLLNTAIQAALQAGREIMQIYTDPSQDFGIEKKADNSPLTLADKAAHCRIMTFLEPTGIPVLSEEGRHLPFEERQSWERLWVVDPLDGTKEFIKKNGEFTVNIALVDGQQPVMGVIYVPAKGDLYWGSERGAFKASVPCGEVFPDVEDIFPQSSSLPLQGAVHDGFVVVASRSHMSIETQDYVNEMSRIHQQVELISSGSSIKICMVAEGTADAYPRYAPTMEWDTAAGDAIARAAGCMVMDANTVQPLQYNKADLLNPWFLVERAAK